MSTACTKCGQSVIWKKDVKAGHMQCYNIDGKTVHWDDCSKNRWRQTKKTGDFFVVTDPNGKPVAAGFKNSVHGTKLGYQASEPIRGEKYNPTGKCRECVPPWEDCDDCPDAFEKAVHEEHLLLPKGQLLLFKPEEE